MAHTQDPPAKLPLTAGSQILQYQPIALLAGTSEVAIPAASVNQEPIGLAIATVASGGAVEFIGIGGVGKAIAAASTGAGARVGVTATTGLQVGPLAVSGASAGIQKWSVGQLLKNAAAGDVVPIYVNPHNVL
jgi:hypothetical protein